LAIGNALQLETARATPVLFTLITTPCQVWSRSAYPIHCRLIADATCAV